MGRRIVQMSPGFLQSIITDGWTIEEDRTVRVTGGIPKTAKLIRWWVDQSLGRDGALRLLFEDSSWEGPINGDVIPILTPVFQSEIRPKDVR